MFRDIGKEVFEHSILCSAESLKRHNYAMGRLAQKAMRAKPAASHHMLAYLGALQSAIAEALYAKH